MMMMEPANEEPTNPAPVPHSGDDANAPQHDGGGGGEGGGEGEEEHRGKQEIRMTINTDGSAVVDGSEDRSIRRNPQRRSDEAARRHAEEVAMAVERLVLEKGVGGATTVPAAYAVRPRSLSSSTSSSSGLVREKLVTLVTAALAPLDEANAADHDDGDGGVDEGDEGDGGNNARMAEEGKLFGGGISPRASSKENGEEEALGEVSITVPSTVDKDLMLSQSEHDRYVMNVVQRLIPIAGRVTAVPATGYWMLESPTTSEAGASSNEPRLMQERVTIVSAACVVDDEVRASVRDTARWLARVMGQEAVFVKINNQPYLIRVDQRESGEGTTEQRREKKKAAKKQRGRRSNKLFRFFTMEPTVVYDCNYQEK